MTAAVNEFGLKTSIQDLRATLDHAWRYIREKASRCARETFSIQTVLDRLPICKWLPKYRMKEFQGDVIAGFTVGLTLIPQAIAYAKIAELSPQYGLYSAFMGCLIYMIFGTSKDVAVGPTAIMSLLTAEFARSPIEGDATYAILLSFIGGFVQLGFAVFRIGFVVDYISHPVINGFTVAAAITIAWSQIKKWLGLTKIPRDFINEVYWDFKKIPQTRLYDFLMGLVCIIALYILKVVKGIEWKEKVTRGKRAIKYVIWLITTARNAVVVVLSSSVAAIFLEYRLKPFSLTGNIVKGLPPFKAPEFTLTYNNYTENADEIFRNIGAGFIIVPIIGLVETVAISKAFGKKNNYNIDANQELLAIGMSNILGSFVGSYPVTGGFARTALNAASGVMTPAGGIFAAILVMLAAAFLTPLFYYIPDSALAAVIIMAVTDMIDFSLLKKLWRIKKTDILPWLATFVCSLVLGIEWGIVIGVGISLLYLLYPWATPTLTVNAIEMEQSGYLVITASRGILFPGVEHFKDKIYDTVSSVDGHKYKAIVLNFKYVETFDLTAVEGMNELLKDFFKRDMKTIVCNARTDVLTVLEKADLKHFVHAKNLKEALKLIGEGDHQHDDISKHSSPTDCTTVNRMNHENETLFEIISRL